MPRPRRSAALVALLLVTAGCTGPASDGDGTAPAVNPTASPPSSASGSDPSAITYADTIRPMLEDACLACHGRWFPQASLSMDTRDGLIEGGRSGPAVLPGEPDKGWLIHSITVEDGRYRMPPVGDRLTPEQVSLVRRWIAAGAR